MATIYREPLPWPDPSTATREDIEEALASRAFGSAGPASPRDISRRTMRIALERGPLTDAEHQWFWRHGVGADEFDRHLRRASGVVIAATWLAVAAAVAAAGIMLYITT